MVVVKMQTWPPEKDTNLKQPQLCDHYVYVCMYEKCIVTLSSFMLLIVLNDIQFQIRSKEHIWPSLSSSLSRFLDDSWTNTKVKRSIPNGTLKSTYS